jgi:hypothetical protein
MLIALGACTGSDDTSHHHGEPERVAPGVIAPSPRDDFPVGAVAEFSVYAHCGVEFAGIDGTLWRTERRDDGDGNPPKGWPVLIEGTLTRPSTDQIVFTSTEIPVTLVFRPAPEAHYLCG